MILDNGAISRADLARHVNLSKQSVSSIVDELIEDGYVKEGQSRVSGIGKPATPIIPEGDRSYTIGLHLDAGRLYLVTASLSTPVMTTRMETIDTSSEAQALEQVTQIIGETINTTQRRLNGVGLAMPGLFGIAGLGPTQLRNWNGVAFGRKLENRIGYRVSFSSESIASAIAERRFGCARGFQNFAYIHVGIGVGSGLVVNGHEVIGASGNSGDLGHVIVTPDGNPCICGKRGCLETYISSSSLQRFISEHGNTPDSIALWRSGTADPMRIVINMIENLIDPETIIVGGDAEDWLIEALIEESAPLYPSPGSRNRATPRVIRSTFNQNVSAIGAAVLPILASLDPNHREPQSL